MNISKPRLSAVMFKVLYVGNSPVLGHRNASSLRCSF